MNRRRLLLGGAASLIGGRALALPAVMLAQRVRQAGLVVHVTPTGQDVPGAGLTFQNGFATPGYAMEWLAANADCGNVPPTIVIDSGCTITSNAFSTVGLIHLRDIMAPSGDWSAPVPLPMVTGGVNGVPIDIASWGERNPGPLITGNGINAVCGVGVNTVWLVRCMQLQSTGADVIADRGTKVNVACIAHGAFFSPYPSPGKEAAEYGGSIENFGGCVVNAGGHYMYSAQVGGQIIGQDKAPLIGPGTAPVYARGVEFTKFLGRDEMSSIAIPASWRRVQ